MSKDMNGTHFVPGPVIPGPVKLSVYIINGGKMFYGTYQWC